MYINKMKRQSTKQKVQPEPVVEVTPEVTEPTVDEPVEDSLESKTKMLEDKINSLYLMAKELKTEYKNLISSHAKQIKSLKKKKNKVKSAYTPHGFTKAVNISPELAKFLKVESDALVARPSVTAAISKYVKEHKLADEKNGSIFKADKSLKSILGEPVHVMIKKKPELGNGYSYQNLQKYLTHHFKN